MASLKTMASGSLRLRFKKNSTNLQGIGCRGEDMGVKIGSGGHGAREDGGKAIEEGFLQLGLTGGETTMRAIDRKLMLGGTGSKGGATIGGFTPRLVRGGFSQRTMTTIGRTKTLGWHPGGTEEHPMEEAGGQVGELLVGIEVGFHLPTIVKVLGRRGEGSRSTGGSSGWTIGRLQEYLTQCLG